MFDALDEDKLHPLAMGLPELCRSLTPRNKTGNTLPVHCSGVHTELRGTGSASLSLIFIFIFSR